MTKQDIEELINDEIAEYGGNVQEGIEAAADIIAAVHKGNTQEAQEAAEAYEDERDMNERLKEITVDARARLAVLSDYFNFAGQNDEVEVNLSDAFNLMFMLKDTERVISKKLNDLLIDNGVHVKEAC